MALQNPFGFSTGDFIELGLAALLLLLVMSWHRVVEPVMARAAGQPGWCMVVLAILPVGLRLALLHSHPVPVSETADEFRNLLAADTLAHFRLTNPPHALAQFFEADRAVHGIGNNWYMILAGMALVGPGALVALRRLVQPHVALAVAAACCLGLGPLHPWAYSYSGHYFLLAAALFMTAAIIRVESPFDVSVLQPRIVNIALVVFVAAFGLVYAKTFWRPVPQTLRAVVARRLRNAPGKLLVFVHGAAPDQARWVWNEADIETARIVFAHDLSEPENAKLRHHFQDRKVFLLEPDQRPARLSAYDPTPVILHREPEPRPQKDITPDVIPDIIPGLRLEQVR